LQFAGGAIVLVQGARIAEVGTTFASCFWLVPLPAPPPALCADASLADAKSSAMAILAPMCASLECIGMTISPLLIQAALMIHRHQAEPSQKSLVALR
jgi:hypothetical protein